MGSLNATVPDTPYRRYQRTASEITSRGNRKPAKTELVPDAVAPPVSSHPRPTNATVPHDLPLNRRLHVLFVMEVSTRHAAKGSSVPCAWSCLAAGSRTSASGLTNKYQIAA